MRVPDELACSTLLCSDVARDSYWPPPAGIDPAVVRVVMIAEAPAASPADDFYAGPGAFFFQTTAQAFADAGVAIDSMQGVLELGIYLTMAVKCAKVGNAVSPRTVRACSELLSRELAPFSNVKAYLLMGDVAIMAMNQIARVATGSRAVPEGSTYKIREGCYQYAGARVFPSYLQTGKSYLIEKSKRRMIAEDIRAALELVR